MKHNNQLCRFFIFVTVSLLFSYVETYADATTYDYERLNQLTDSQLLTRGEEFLETDTLINESILCFSIVVNRYYDNRNDKEACSRAITAMRTLGNIYMARYFDYQRAYLNLAMARQIAEETGDAAQLPYIYTSISNLWQMNTHLNDRSHKQAETFLHKALETAIISGNEDILPVIAINYVSYSMRKGSYGEYAADVEKWKNYKFKTRPELLSYARMMIKGADAFLREDYDTAGQAFQQASKAIDTYLYPERYIFAADIALARTHMATDKYEQAEMLLSRNAKIAHSQGIADYELFFYGMLANLYEQMEKTDSLNKYYFKYLAFKESVSNNKKLNMVEEAEFIAQIDAINKEVRQLSVKRTEQQRNLAIIAAILVAVSIAFAALIWAYRSLKRNHRKIYEKNVELLRANKELSHLRQASTSDSKLADEEKTPSVNEGISKTQNEQLSKVWNRVIQVMDNSQEIYDTDFRLSRLAELVGFHYRTVSQAINTFYHSNFNQLLIDRRIQEASRRMHQPEYARHTLEAIATSVGFNSRTSFSAIFKKKTGLTPSEYFKMARTERID